MTQRGRAAPGAISHKRTQGTQRFKLFCGLDGGADGGFGDGPNGLGGIVCVPAQFDATDTIGVGLDCEGGEGGFGAKGAACEMLAIRAGVGKGGAAGGQKGEEKEMELRFHGFVKAK